MFLLRRTSPWAGSTARLCSGQSPRSWSFSHGTCRPPTPRYLSITIPDEGVPVGDHAPGCYADGHDVLLGIPADGVISHHLPDVLHQAIVGAPGEDPSTCQQGGRANAQLAQSKLPSCEHRPLKTPPPHEHQDTALAATLWMSLTYNRMERKKKISVFLRDPGLKQNTVSGTPLDLHHQAVQKVGSRNLHP